MKAMRRPDLSILEKLITDMEDELVEGFISSGSRWPADAVPAERHAQLVNSYLMALQTYTGMVGADIINSSIVRK